MSKLGRIAIFGCGAAGLRARLQLKSKYNITAFLDNSGEKQGSVIAGVPVRNPENFNYESVEHVFIASMYLDQILVQLLALGVPASKIEYLSEESLMRSGPHTGMLGIPRRAFNAVLPALYVPFRLLR